MAYKQIDTLTLTSAFTIAFMDTLESMKLSQKERQMLIKVFTSRFEIHLHGDEVKRVRKLALEIWKNEEAKNGK